MSPSPPDSEAARLEAVRRYGILDTPPEPAFDDLAALAARLCGTAMAWISFVDGTREWFKARIGFEARQVPREVSFCGNLLMEAAGVRAAVDVQEDRRLAQNPLLAAESGIRFVAGVPLVSPGGQTLGSLGVMDREPRVLAGAQIQALEALGRQVMAQLELRRQAGELERSRRALLSVLEDEKLSGQNLRESETRFRQMAENINEVFWMVDPIGRRVLYISPAYERIWHRPCPPPDTPPEFWLASVVAEDWERVAGAMATMLRTGECREEYRIARPDGSTRWIFDQAFPLRDATGRLYRVVGVAQDVTERRQLEERFLHAQRLEAIGTLAGGVAHDLNNILAPVLMVSGLIKEKLPDAADQELLALVESSAQRGAGIIRQLLTFSRGATGERLIVQLRHLVKDMVSIMVETFPRDLTIIDASAVGLWPVAGDPTQLHQVLMNLCVNARDAMPNGGKLTLQAQNVHVSDAEARLLPGGREGDFVRLSVEDTGHGISQSVRERIFDPFFTTKEPGKGTGLGLSTVLGILKSHKGFITVRSVPGEGTVFHVYFPAAQEVPALESNPSPIPHQGRGETILVVDDETAVSLAAQRLLLENNYRALAAANGREALALYMENQETVKLVLTDIMMPVMNGVALVRALSAVNPDLRFIVATGLGEEDKLNELAALGVTEILPKPYQPAILLHAIRRQLEKS